MEDKEYLAKIEINILENLKKKNRVMAKEFQYIKMGIVMKVNLNQMNKFQGQFFIKMDIYSQENFNKNIKTKYILLVEKAL